MNKNFSTFLLLSFLLIFIYHCNAGNTVPDRINPVQRRNIRQNVKMLKKKFQERKRAKAIEEFFGWTFKPTKNGIIIGNTNTMPIGMDYFLKKNKDMDDFKLLSAGGNQWDSTAMVRNYPTSHNIFRIGRENAKTAIHMLG